MTFVKAICQAAFGHKIITVDRRLDNTIEVYRTIYVYDNTPSHLMCCHLSIGAGTKILSIQ